MGRQEEETIAETQPAAAGAARPGADADGPREDGLNRREVLGGVSLASLGAIAGAGAAGHLGAAAPAGAACEIGPEDPAARKLALHQLRVAAADAEVARPTTVWVCNGDEDLYPTRIASFSKTLPHNDNGEVDAAAYDTLLAAVASGSFDDLDAVPAGGVLTLVNPLGGLAYNLEGSDITTLSALRTPWKLDSAEFATEMAELYWMMLARQVDFSEYATHPTARLAAVDLARFSGYTGPKDDGGVIQPNMLFRVNYPGVFDGPLLSQYLVQPYFYDGVVVEQRLRTPSSTTFDFITIWDEFLDAQRGFPDGIPTQVAEDLRPRFVSNGRRAADVASKTNAYSVSFKAALILLPLGGDWVDPGNPYKVSTRQGGFCSLGLAHLFYLLGKVDQAERACWYLKWQVHRLLRPEAAGGRVHQDKSGIIDYPLHPELMDLSAVLPRVFEANRENNFTRLGIDEGSYLLAQTNRTGCPAHPSFPAGHAVTAGAGATLLKAWFNEDALFPNPLKVINQGTATEPYIPGVDGPDLTIGGELNKLAWNISLGRAMDGIHYRIDLEEGLKLGEEMALRILQEEKANLRETFTWTLKKFDGTTVVI